MRTESYNSILHDKLMVIVHAIETQTCLSGSYPKGQLSFHEHIDQLKEYIEVGGEYGIAFESIVATLETVPFSLIGSEAICLLEVGLLLNFKTEREEDSIYDSRK